MVNIQIISHFMLSKDTEHILKLERRGEIRLNAELNIKKYIYILRI